MHDYAYAANKTKLFRALQELPNGSEEEVKARYIELGGKVLDQGEQKVAEEKEEKKPKKK